MEKNHVAEKLPDSVKNHWSHANGILKLANTSDSYIPYSTTGQQNSGMQDFKRDKIEKYIPDKVPEFGTKEYLEKFGPLDPYRYAAYSAQRGG